MQFATLTAAPFSAVGGQSIYAKVAAVNFYGESELSLPGNGAYFTTVPDKPHTLAEKRDGKSADTVTVTWVDGSNNGGVSIIDYRMQYSVSGSSDVTTIENISTLEHTVSGLTLGTTYEFVIQAQNEVGYSVESDPLVILHALAPEQPVAPTTQNSGQDIIISWTAPNDRGSAISSYTITILQKDGNYSEELNTCDGS